MVAKDIKLSFNELQQLIGKKKKRGKKKGKVKGKKKGVAFKEIRHNPDMRNFVTSSSVFPNSGAGALSREIDILRGEVNQKANALIGAGKTKEAAEYKSEFHKMTNQIADDVLAGRRNFRQNKDGSITATPPIMTQQRNKPLGRPPGSKNKVKVVDLDGIGDYSISRFTPPSGPPNPLFEEVEDEVIHNEQPKEVVFIPTGDDVDVPTSQWIDIDSTQTELSDADYPDDDMSDITMTSNVETIAEEKNVEKQPPKIKKQFVCPECGKKLSSNQRLKSHLETKHPDVEVVTKPRGRPKKNKK